MIESLSERVCEEGARERGRESERADVGVEIRGHQCFSIKWDDILKTEFSFLNVDYTRISWTVFTLGPEKHEKLGLSICPWL